MKLSGYRKVLDGWGSWSIGIDILRNVIIFGVDHSSACHADNHKNNLLVLE